VIGGKCNDQGIAVALGGKGRTGGDGRTGIATDRLEHDIGFDPNCSELFGDQETILSVGDDGWTAEQTRI
jgi:hypothetical protein